MSYTAANQKKDEAVDTAKKAGRQFQDAGKQAIDEAQGDFADTARHAGQEVRRYFTTAVDKAEEVTHDVESRIRNKPVEATLIALGVGFLVGLLTRK